MRIVITGAAGTVGAKVRKRFEASGHHNLVLIDKTPGVGDASIIVADLSRNIAAWSDLFAGAVG